MLVTLLSWLYIAATAFLCGILVLRPLRGRGLSPQDSFDLIFFVGLAALTAYAQLFSLFAPVGPAATLILVLICAVAAVAMRRSLAAYGAHVRAWLKKPHVWLTLLLLGLALLVVAAGPAHHYDTDLYHAQAIRWIEEFGIVKGLGNLHSRLAYNSAFFSLQALYSLKFLSGQSLHSLNGLIVYVMLAYAFVSLSFFHRRRFAASDLIKICFFLYFFLGGVHYGLASPGTDIATLYLVLYLAAKWAEYAEQEAASAIGSESALTEYGLLCILAVWALTLKLSALTLLLLAVCPAVRLIAGRKWKKIALFMLMGLALLLPFLARNVVVSGYLVFPLAASDPWALDWKMPLEVLRSHSVEIRAYGRGMTEPGTYLAPLAVWLPLWYGRLSAVARGLLWTNALCLPLALYLAVSSLRRKKDGPLMNLLAVAVVSLAYWLFHAPLERYGYVYLLLLPALTGGLIRDRMAARGQRRQRRKRPRPTRRIVAVAAATILCLGVLAFIGLARVRPDIVERYFSPPLLMPDDYTVYDSAAREWQQMLMYIPVQGGDDRLGYHNFPATPDAHLLDSIELRGAGLREGFRRIKND